MNTNKLLMIVMLGMVLLLGAFFLIPLNGIQQRANAQPKKPRQAQMQRQPMQRMQQQQMCPGQAEGGGLMGMGIILADPQTEFTVSEQENGISISITNPDEHVGRQIQRMGQIIQLRYEMVRSEMERMQSDTQPPDQD